MAGKSTDIRALTVAALADLLRKAGGKVTAEHVEADLAAGAPTNPDGTVNLIEYAAWLVQHEYDRPTA